MNPGVIEQVLAEQYPAFRTDGRDRTKKWEKKVSRVADSPGETEISEHSEEHPPGYYKVGKRHPKKKEEHFEDLFNFTVINFLV